MIRRAAVLAAVVLCVCAFGEAQATDYYVDYTGGADGNSGTSWQSPWKTLARVNTDTVLQAGNTVYFKRGEVWRLTDLPGTQYDSWRIIGAEGTSASPITITDYGSGNDPAPLLTTLEKWDSLWTEVDTNIWKHADVENLARRLFIDGIGQGRTYIYESLGDTGCTWYCDAADSGDLYLYSQESPNGLNIETLPGPYDVDGSPAGPRVIEINGCEHVVLENLALYGGYSANLWYVGAGSGFKVLGCDLRYSGNSGIVFWGLDDAAGFHDIAIEDNSIDFMLNRAEIQEPGVNGSTAYFPNTGSSDGIDFIDHATDVVVARNFVKDFSHNQIQLLGRNSSLGGVTGITIESNELTSPNTIHGYPWGSLGVEGKNTGNVFRWNYGHDVPAHCSTNGDHNKYYGNIIVNLRDDYNYDSNAMALNAWPGSYVNSAGQTVLYATVCHDNEIFNNTIVAADGQGIIVSRSCTWDETGLCGSVNDVTGNFIANNIVVDCGDSAGLYQLEVSYYTALDDGIYGNFFANNCLYRSDASDGFKAILYKNVEYSVDEADTASLDDDFLNTIDESPLFVDYDPEDYDPEDYELQSDSPCKWTGYPLDGQYEDFNGDRFKDPPSRGALETNRSSPGDDGPADSGPTRLSLTAHPNPFGPSTALRFTLAQAGPIKLTIHDPMGRLVATVADEHRDAGEQEIPWNGTNAQGQHLSSGVYFARLIAAEDTVFRKLILVR